ncbi:MAG TPA: hypothetical protein VF746_11800 [Longimicrobium sp.]
MARLIGFVVVAVAGFLGGYLFAGQQRTGEADPPAAAAPAPDSSAPDSARPAAAPAGDSAAVIRAGAVPRLYPTLIDSAGVDVDADGTEERIELYADVGRDTRGRPMWDDGQRWALIVRDDSLAYTLFDDFVQLGSVSFVAWVNAGDTPSVILVEVETPSGDTFESFVFDKQRGGFVRAGSLRAGVSGNIVHRPPPSYDG